MLAIHPRARTTPAVRAEIARSSEGTGVLANRYGVSSETNANGANAAPMRVRTARRDPISCPGAPVMRSAPSCARSAAPPAFPSTR